MMRLIHQASALHQSALQGVGSSQRCATRNTGIGNRSIAKTGCRRVRFLRRATLRAVLAVLLAAAMIGASTPACIGADSPLEPEAALADFQLAPGYRIEIAAAEPQVVDPIAIAFDESGKLWVVEMRDYPILAEGEKPASRIRVLEDRNDDGRYETSTLFADELLFPTGVQPWQGGAIVTLAGEIAYFKDTDNDGRADQKETWYQGFATANEQLRANHPRLGADGNVYVAGGLRGGTVKNLRSPQSTDISINGRDFAFDPISGASFAASGLGQFGLTFDDFGQRFTCSNRNPLMHAVIEQRYLDRNPKLLLPTVIHDVASAGDDSRLFPRTRALTTSALHAGQFTAACGVEIFRGSALPADAIGNAFICEPTGNLVHREAITPSGATFTSQPVERDSEFLSSTDEWFRPVNLLTGPDGALYVVDMYRAIIEHPEWVPEDVRSQLNRRDGNDRGRIYRIVADATTAAPRERPTIQATPLNELVLLLEHPNAWHRETAARLLLEANATSAATELQRIATESKLAPSRFQALCLLESLGELDDTTLASCLRDSAPGVLARAVVLAENRLERSPELTRSVLALAHDSDSRVRFQVALSTSFLPPASIVPTLETIARQDGGDVWVRRAVALAARSEVGVLLARLLKPQSGRPVNERLPPELVAELASAVVAVGDHSQVADALSLASHVDRATASVLLLTIADACARRGESIESVLSDADPSILIEIRRHFDDAIHSLEDADASDEAALAAARLLQFDSRALTCDALLAALKGSNAPLTQTAIIDALRNRDDSRIPTLLIELFPQMVPSVRRASLDLLIGRAAWSLALLEAAESERIAIANIDATRAHQLRQHKDEAVRALANRILGSGSRNREQVVRQYQSVLALTGDLRQGKKVFAANCASCHRVGTEGTAIGPDIGDSAMKSSAQLLIDILQPNQAIDANYISYTAITSDGQTYSGIIRSETDTGIVLQSADGKTHTILRSDLDSLSGALSLMPEGMEQQVSPQQMADLLAFLKSWREL